MRKRRRARRNRYRLVVVSVWLFLLAFVGFSFNSPSVIARNQNTVKCYTSVQVDAGDSLWSIATAHMTSEYRNIDDYINEIKVINGISGNMIQQGSYLNIPYYLDAQ